MLLLTVSFFMLVCKYTIPINCDRSYEWFSMLENCSAYVGNDVVMHLSKISKAENYCTSKLFLVMRVLVQQ